MRSLPAQSTSPTRRAASRPNQRLLAKQKTRERVQAAARELFAQRGFDGATLRDIAQRAGMSTGAVFASFSDKAELFEAILMADFADVGEAMRDELAGHDNLDDGLAAQFKILLDQNLEQLPILRSWLSMSWARDDAGLARGAQAVQDLRAIITETLDLAITRRQLSDAADTALIARLLWDAYLADLRRVAFFSTSPEAVAERQRQHAEVILRGYHEG